MPGFSLEGEREPPRRDDLFTEGDPPLAIVVSGDVKDLSLADRRPPAHRLGRARHAGTPRDPRAVRGGEAAGGHADVGLPARDGRDRQPRPDPGRRRRRPGARRLEPALDPGRRRGQPGAGFQHPGLRDQGRGRVELLPAHRRRAEAPSQRDDGRRRRPGQRDDLHRPEPPRRPTPRGPELGEEAQRRRSGMGWSPTSSPAWRRRRPA